jgi:hypothetical protein
LTNVKYYFNNVNHCFTVYTNRAENHSWLDENQISLTLGPSPGGQGYFWIAEGEGICRGEALFRPASVRAVWPAEIF